MNLQSHGYELPTPTGQLAALLAAGDVTNEQLQDPAQRRQLVALLHGNGVLNGRDECENFVDVLAKSVAGVSLSESMRAWLAEARAGIAQWLKVEAARARAWEQEAELGRNKKARANMLELIEMEVQRLRDLEGTPSRALKNYRERVVGNKCIGAAAACAYGNDIIGAREGVRFLREEIIPALRGELKALDEAIAAAGQK